MLESHLRHLGREKALGVKVKGLGIGGFMRSRVDGWGLGFRVYTYVYVHIYIYIHINV